MRHILFPKDSSNFVVLLYYKRKNNLSPGELETKRPDTAPAMAGPNRNNRKLKGKSLGLNKAKLETTEQPKTGPDKARGTAMQFVYANKIHYAYIYSKLIVEMNDSTQKQLINQRSIHMQTPTRTVISE